MSFKKLDGAENIEMKLDEKWITLRVPIDAEPYGSSEKTYKLATTRGNKQITEDTIDDKDLMRIGLTIFKYRKRK